jgi:hypothetical protein
LNNILFLNPPNYPIIRRVINEYTILEFKMSLSCVSWADVFNINDDVNLMFSNFVNTYLRIFNHSSPYKNIFQVTKI